MDNIWIYLNRLYQNKKFIIILTIAACTLFVLVSKEAGKISEGGSNENATSEGVSETSSINQVINEIDVDNYEDMYKYVNSDSERIKIFITACINNKIDLAYELLTNDCKEALYPTKQDFLDSYYNVIFKTNNSYEIASFKNNTYKVKYMEDAIHTGSSPGSGIVDYITVHNNGKISISGFIENNQLDIESIGTYFSVNVINRQIYTNYQVYTVKIKNNTRADIYINDVNHNGIYIKNSRNNTYDIDMNDYFDFNYLVPAKSEIEIDLKFNVDYIYDNEFMELCFGNMKIVNKEYYDSTSSIVDRATGEITYEKKKTNYPETYSYNIKLN